MIKTTVSKILGAFDLSMENGEKEAAARDENLFQFFEIAYEDVRRIVMEIAAADKRVTIEERNMGFFVLFEGEVLFRAAVLRLSDRVEVKVDSQRVAVYYGGEIDLTKYSSACKISLSIRNAAIMAFSREILVIATRKLNAL